MRSAVHARLSTLVEPLAGKAGSKNTYLWNSHNIYLYESRDSVINQHWLNGRIYLFT